MDVPAGMGLLWAKQCPHEQCGHFVPGLEGWGTGRLTHSESWRGGERTLGNLPPLTWAAHLGVGAEVKNNFRLYESGREITARASPYI